MKLIMLGTGNASVVKCYNTCFAIEDQGEYMLVDGGGGNGIFRQLEQAGIDFHDIHHIFVTHKHLDHMLGILWMVRMICQHTTTGEYKGEAYIYTHKEVADLLRSLAKTLIRAKDNTHLDKTVHIVELSDGDEFEAIGHKFIGFDIHSSKANQFGFCMDDKVLTCLGDEPYYEHSKKYVEGATFLMHEAFCMYAEADRFEPYEKHHSTVKDACELAEELGVKNLILYHTEDSDLEHRKERYTSEGKQVYGGNLFVPDDLEVIEIC